MHDDTSNVLSLSVEELDLAIGESLLAGGFGMKPASDAEKQATAHRWFESKLNQFRTTVCPNPIVCGLLGQKNTKRNELFAAVVDALMTVGGWGTIPVAVLSARLLHYGLDKLCSSYKEQSLS